MAVVVRMMDALRNGHRGVNDFGSGICWSRWWMQLSEDEELFRSTPEFEKMPIRSGLRLIKYWFSITDEEQDFRFSAPGRGLGGGKAWSSDRRTPAFDAAEGPFH
jgi:polyphosphate kinase 2 (PPK2 family)